MYNDYINKIKMIYSQSSDAVFREFVMGNKRCFLFFIDGMVDKTTLEKFLIQPLMNATGGNIPEEVLPLGEVKTTLELQEALEAAQSGDSVLVIEGQSEIIIAGTRGFDLRSIGEPQNEAVVIGPKEAFTEGIRNNTSMLRRRIKSPKLVLKHITAGEFSKTTVVIAYMEGFANKQLVGKIEKKLSSSQIKVLTETAQAERALEGNVPSPFPQIITTERPDKVCFSLSRGKVAVIIDGSPFALILPTKFSEFFQSPEDHYSRVFAAQSIRLLRKIGAIIALFAPAIYIAIVSFHPGMLPTQLALSIAASRVNVPFPAIVEALLMELALELLREAGVRLPNPVGQSVGIVGGIVIGDAAVKAGITSPLMIIVVAITAIASYVIPSYSMSAAFRMLRFAVMIIASMLGLYGVVLAFIMLIIHLETLESGGERMLNQNIEGLNDMPFYIPKLIFNEEQEHSKIIENERLMRVWKK